MAITDKTRKELWAKSGNRCAICQKELVDKISNDENSFIVGDECHIISSKEAGPRHKPGLKDYDSYDNLLLLCKNHHKEIDENCNTYSEEILRYIKTKHENWVNETLGNSKNRKSSHKPRFIRRITSGKDLMNIFQQVAFIYKDYDEPSNEEECDYIAGIFQHFTDIIDICNDFEAYDTIKEGYKLNEVIKELENKGFYVYSESHKVTLAGENPIVCKACTIILKRVDCQGIYCIYD